MIGACRIPNKRQREKYLPWFNHLYENKIIYRDEEGQIFIVKIIKSPNGEIHEGVIHKTIYAKTDKRGTKIKFVITWFHVLLLFEETKSFTYKSSRSETQTFWLRPDFVMYIEKLLDYGDFDDIMELLNKTPKPNLSIENRFRKSKNL